MQAVELPDVEFDDNLLIVPGDACFGDKHKVGSELSMYFYAVEPLKLAVWLTKLGKVLPRRQYFAKLKLSRLFFGSVGCSVCWKSISSILSQLV